MSRAEIWDEVHIGLKNLHQNYANPTDLGLEVANLRRSYRGMKFGSASPDFFQSGTRDAYAMAYHPGHASSYLHIYLNKGVGDKIVPQKFQKLKIGVLGAGCAAETLALIYFLKNKQSQASQITIGLIDRADWSQQREHAFFAQLARLDQSLAPQIETYTCDLLTAPGTNFMKQYINKCDLIICPAVFTELEAETQSGGKKVMQLVIELMNVGAKLLLVDESDINEFDEYRQRLINDGRVRCITTDHADIAVPHPPSWLRDIVLNYTDYRIPRTSYRLAWALLERA